MSGRLVGEVVEWLRTPAAEGVTTAEAAVLLIIAERANEKDREMWRHRGDDEKLIERICGAAKLSPAGASNVFKKLARQGLEVRIPLKRGKDGRAVYAFEGQAMRFRLPELPASVALPERAVTEPPSQPVDNASKESSKHRPGASRGQSQNRPQSRQGGHTTAHSGPEGGHTTAPSTSKDNPSTTDPSSCGSSTYGVAVEDEMPADVTPPAGMSHMGWEPDYIEAREYLFTLANEGQGFMDAARQRLGPRADVADRVIYAAQIARKASAS